MLGHRIFLACTCIVGGAQGQQFLFSLAVDPLNAVYGVQVVAGGDYDGDGTSDFAVLELGNELVSNRQQVIRLCSGVDGHQIRHYSHPTPNTAWIHRIAAVGDLDGDSVPDIAVCAGTGIDIRSGASLGWLRGLGAVSAGYSDVLAAGDLDGDMVPDVIARSSALSPASYHALSGSTGTLLWGAPDAFQACAMGDVNNDQVPDFFVTGSQGCRAISGSNGQSIWTANYGLNVSRQISGLGDTNLDGVPDVAISSPFLCGGGSCYGRVEILSGMNGQSLQVVTKNDPYSEFGSELCPAGDLTGNGRCGFLAAGHSSPDRLFGVAGDGTDVFSLDGPYFGSLIGGFDVDSNGLSEFAYFSLGPSTGMVNVLSLVRATYSTFGGGCPGSLGIPALTAVNLPRIGSHFDLHVSNLRPLQLGFVYTGFSDQVWTSAGQPLPVALAPMGLPGCTLYIDPVVDGVTQSGAGTAAWGFAVPQAPDFYGLQFFNQAVFFDPFTSAGVVISNAGRGRMGG